MNSEILLGVGMFTVIVLSLVVLILVARSWLVSSGDVTIEINGELLPEEGKELTRLRAEVGMVFQSFNLFPHRTVLDNITLAPVRVRGIARSEAETITRQADEARKQAERDAETIRSEAQDEAEREAETIRSEATRDAENTRSEARSDATDIRDAARSEAEQVARDRAALDSEREAFDVEKRAFTESLEARRAAAEEEAKIIIEEAVESLQDISNVDQDFLQIELDRDPEMKQRYRETVIDRTQRESAAARRRAQERIKQRRQQQRQRDRDGGMEL